MLVDSGSFKHFIDAKLIRVVESRMMNYTEINLPMKIKTMSYNTLVGTAQDILLVLVRDTQNVCRTIKLLIVLVPGLGRNVFPAALATQKHVKTMLTKTESAIDLGIVFNSVNEIE